MDLVEFADANDRDVWVNPLQVTSVSLQSTEGSNIHLADGRSLYVKGLPRAVATKLRIKRST